MKPCCLSAFFHQEICQWNHPENGAGCYKKGFKGFENLTRGDDEEPCAASMTSSFSVCIFSMTHDSLQIIDAVSMTVEVIAGYSEDVGIDSIFLLTQGLPSAQPTKLPVPPPTVLTTSVPTIVPTTSPSLSLAPTPSPTSWTYGK